VSGDRERQKAKTAAQTSSAESAGRGSIVPLALPKGLYAHFLLVDIASPVREIRGVPRYMPIKETPTFLGRNEKVHILLDDPWTIDLWHARVDLREAEGKTLFVIYPVEKARIAVNGEVVEPGGFVLASEDVIQIGSARLIFFQRDINAVSSSSR
jgi:hypothetical protein